jgi:hypothetical protein
LVISMYENINKFRMELKYQLFRIVYGLVSLLSKKRKFSEKYIISFTTTRERFPHIWPTLKSLLNQTQPLKIVLILDDSNKDFLDLTPVKAMLMEKKLDIIWDARKLRSYNKLIPASELYSTKNIVTVDDDIIYHPKMIERLIDLSESNKSTIIANQCRLVGFNRATFKPYESWGISKSIGYNRLNLAMGCGGILYPQKFIEKLIKNIDLTHLDLAPKQDDIFFFAFGKKYKFKVFNAGNWRLVEVPIFEQFDALKLVNLNSTQNVDALKRLVDEMEIMIDV